MVKKAQQYITLFIAILLIFFLIFGTGVIISSLSLQGEKITLLINSDLESIYAIIDTPLYLSLNDISDSKIYYKDIALVNLLSVSYQNSIDSLQYIFEKYNSTFKQVFNDLVCIEQYELDSDGKKSNIVMYNECKKSKDSVLLTFGKYNFKISIQKESDQKFIMNEALEYLKNVQQN
ncbi:MAG: hypothetical protein QXS41_03610 [Candidatus Woesearchaeota archaeon]